jgi:hypothetical protein
MLMILSVAERVNQSFLTFLALLPVELDNKVVITASLFKLQTRKNETH